MNAVMRGTADCLIVWIRRELRVNDHLALWRAVQDGKRVAPLFIVDRLFHGAAPAQQSVITDGLRQLRDSLASLGGNLIIRSGDPKEVLFRVISETGSAGVYTTKRYHPEERTQDAKIGSMLTDAGKVWKAFKDHVLFEEDEIVNRSKSQPYVVFTSYRKAWRERQAEILPPLPGLKSVVTPELYSEAFPAVSSGAPGGGEQEGIKALNSFLNRRIGTYHDRRDYVGDSGTSRLSHHLTTGSLGIRTVYQKVREASERVRELPGQGIDAFLNQLIWREFYYQIMANFPHVTAGAFKRSYDAVRWTGSRGLFDAWRNGMTGYPIVDAAMRQLKSEGWMHNRGRMITANFLTKDLHTDWREGEAHFMRHLADGDAALNNGGWQWCAGTGNDAQPWFRIFNPVRQSKKFDPSGRYIRKYVPELNTIPDRFLHEPWRMSTEAQKKSDCIIGKHYPAPVVNHETERENALALYGRVSETVSRYC